MAEEGLTNTIVHGKVFGKVPVWAAGVGFAAIFIAFMVWRNNRNAKANKAVATGDGTIAASPQDPNAIDPNTGLPYSEAYPTGAVADFLNGNPGYSAYPVGITPQGLPSPITNTQWSRIVLDGLLAKGDDPTLVNNALQKFLAGSPLSQAEQSVINLAEQMFGAPPEGLLPITPEKDTTLPALQNLQVSADKQNIRASWDPVPGAQFYTIFWRTKFGSTGGTTIQATSATASISSLGALAKGDNVNVLVVAHKWNDIHTGQRSPDATKDVTIP